MTRKQIISGICLMLAVILIASGSYLFLYHFNNKYTRPSLQPANGLLVLSEEDLAAQPLTFLTSGWAYYPDVLLTPADFDNQTSNHYMIYTEIVTEDGVSCLISTVRESEAPISRLSRVSEERVA